MEVGFGVAGVVVAGVAVGRYVGLLAKLLPVYVSYNGSTLSIRSTPSAPTHS